MSLQAIKNSPRGLSILDQLLLPHQTEYVEIRNTTSAFKAIRGMVVRGAPAIAIVAVLSLAVELRSLPPAATTDVVGFICEKLDYLVQARPTAVNLSDAARKLKAVVRGVEGDSPEEVIDRYVAAAEKMLTDDVEDNKNIGKFGAEWVLHNSETTSDDGKVAVLTHCNTGSLATAGYGTALGIIRSLHAGNHLSHAYCTETRPYNQGSRLTAYELVYENIPGTLIMDSMAAALMRHKPISAVIVGADRVAANGDTANKIGTYQLAVVARHHGVKFVVAAPTTSVDMATSSGADIKIEHRLKEEVTTITGPRYKFDEQVDLDHMVTVSIAAFGIGVFNPAFDVTPKALIDAIVTEKGVAVKDADGNFDLNRFF